MKTYALVGWNPRLKRWDTEQVEARSKVVAKQKFLLMYPSLKKIKMYTLSPLAYSTYSTYSTPTSDWAEHKAAEWVHVRELEEVDG